MSRSAYWALALITALACNTSGSRDTDAEVGAGDAASTADGAPDGATPDGATPDGATPDGATPDGATPDGATLDAAEIDAVVTDAVVMDAAPLEPRGHFTDAPLMCEDLGPRFAPVREALRAQFEPEWYETYAAFIAAFEDDEGLNPDAGREAVMVAALLDDNVYPYCIPALELAEAHPDDPMYLNGAIACLIRLGELELAGALLDCAHALAPDLHITYENGAAWHDAQGHTEVAIEAKAEACAHAPDPSHCNHNGAAYAEQHGQPEAAEGFRAGIPSNYPWDNGDGSSGGGAAPRTGVCCNCNDTLYDDVMVCVDQCQASLGCFTGICTPNLECCGDKSPFTLGIQLCFPPAGPVQACIGGDTTGNLDVSVQGNLAGVVTVGVRGRLSFSGGGAPSTSVGVYGNVMGGAAGLDLDLPSGKVSASTGVSFGGVGITLGLPDQAGWAHIIQCL